MKDNTDAKTKASPPGRVKIMAALKALLEEKDFNAVTTNEIARTAGVTEPLIYKYFKDKRDLLHQLLISYLEPFVEQALKDTDALDGTFNKLKKMIQLHLNAYAEERVFSKILILESRSSAEYFAGDTYQLALKYANALDKIIQDGVRNNEIRDDLPPALIRQVILGSIDHVCMNSVVFNRKIDSEKLTENLYKFLLDGIRKK